MLLKGSIPMAQSFLPGDDLIFQLESGYGLLRVLAVEGEGADTIWHLLAYEELFPDVDSAEQALGRSPLHIRIPHMALSNRAFERTPVARLGNRALSKEEFLPYLQWQNSTTREVSDRSALLMLGIR